MTVRQQSPRPQRRQRGAAIITALLVVALSAILVAGLLWRQQVQIRRIENQRLHDQAVWISRGSFDWTRLILRSEGDISPVTYLGGVWSVPVAETRLSDFLGRLGETHAEEGASTFLSGSIEDAQAKFNLRNLVIATPGALQPDPNAVKSYQRLLSTLGIDSALAQTTAMAMRASLQRSATRLQTVGGSVTPGAAAQSGGFTDEPGLTNSGDDSAVQPLQMTSLDSLLDVPGYTPEAIARLRPFVTILPMPTTVNLNTASAEVISSVVPGLSLPGAQGFVATRDQAFLISVSDADTRLQRFVPGVELDSTIFDVTTRFFIVHGDIRHERAEIHRTALIFRDALRHQTRIVSVQDD